MTTQTPPTGTAAEPINFKNYDRIRRILGGPLADIAAMASVDLRSVFPNDPELRSLRSRAEAADRALDELLDPDDGRYKLPRPPGWDAFAVKVGYDNYDLLRETFPSSRRSEFEARVLLLRDAQLSYLERLTVKFRDLLYSTRIQEELIDEHLRPPYLASWLAFDFSNLKRFQCVFRFDPGDWGSFEHAEIVGQHYHSLGSMLDRMEGWESVTADPRSQFCLELREYLTLADNLRAEILEPFRWFVDFHLETIRSLNPLWSHPGEPYDLESEQAAQVARIPATQPEPGDPAPDFPSPTAEGE